jgi:hypothetical protein
MILINDVIFSDNKRAQKRIGRIQGRMELTRSGSNEDSL